MPDQPWNQDFTHEQVIRYDGNALVRSRIVVKLDKILKDFNSDK
jgi:hypothetical protein